MEDWKDILGKALDSFEDENAGDACCESEIEVSQEKKVQKEAVHVYMERKGRGGKTATIVEGFLCDDDELKEIAKTLKVKIGTGGSARGGEILLQGDWRDRTATLLREMGFKVKG